VEDNGPGVAPAMADKIFEPFFTTKTVGEGTGLGLWISYSIVREHGGDLTLAPDGPGAAFMLRLPRAG
jgi:two-component system sensor histidine kinase HupT/HoxJ